MGRHTAGDGAGVDPIVAAALTRRPAAPEPRHGQGPRPLTGADGEGGLGWPGDPADGTGLGWPGDLRTTSAAGRAATPPVALVPDAGGAPARRRSGWRRLFGGGHSSAA